MGNKAFERNQGLDRDTPLTVLLPLVEARFGSHSSVVSPRAANVRSRSGGSGAQSDPPVDPMGNDLHRDRRFEHQTGFAAVTPADEGIERRQVGECKHRPVPGPQRGRCAHSRTEAGNVANPCAADPPAAAESCGGIHVDTRHVAAPDRLELLADPQQGSKSSSSKKFIPATSSFAQTTCPSTAVSSATRIDAVAPTIGGA